MKIHYLQHVEYEPPGLIIDWAEEKKHKLSFTKFHFNEKLPKNIDFDLLIIMGGPMNIYNYVEFPYLQEEKIFIKKVIDRGISVLGICLGAQLIANVLGAKIEPNNEKEIGWFPIHAVENNCSSELNAIISTDSPVFHWHGDTFGIPISAERIAQSSVCKNQAFIYNKNVFALQYHLEMSKTSLKALIENGRDELIAAPYIQTEEEIWSNINYLHSTNKKLYSLLDYIKQISKIQF